MKCLYTDSLHLTDLHGDVYKQKYMFVNKAGKKFSLSIKKSNIAVLKTNFNGKMMI